MTKKFDYIICGAGLSGLVLSHKIINDRFFDNKSVLIIDKDLSHNDHKTWCFWEDKESVWNDYVVKNWNTICFKSCGINKETRLENFSYKMIKSEFFFESLIQKIRNEKNFTLVEDEIIDILEDSVLTVKTKSKIYHSDFVFNSLFDLNNLKSNYPLLIQHFKGWTIQTENNFFNDEVATIMDFSINQKKDTRFFYVLPTSKNKALVEFTLFSKSFLNDNEYDIELKKYIKQIGINNYVIIEKEKGAIPMTCHPFDENNSKKIINIGTAGGWTKPSSGYTFKFVDKNCEKIISFLKQEKFSKKISFKTRHWIYDLIFLHVLHTKNDLGKKLFEKMFLKNKTELVLRFLDNDTSLKEEINIASSFPKILFTKSLFQNIGKIFNYYL